MRIIGFFSIMLLAIVSCKPYSYKVIVLDGDDKKTPIHGAKVILFNRRSELISTKYTDTSAIVIFDSIIDRKIYVDVSKDGFHPNNGWWPTRDYKKAKNGTYYLRKRQSED